MEFIAPQALPVSDNMCTDMYTMARLVDGSHVENETIDIKTGQVYPWMGGGSQYTPWLSCANGSPGVYNSCICPGSANAKPGRTGPKYDIYEKSLFRPSGDPLYISDVAQCLIDQRSPSMCKYNSFF